MIITELESQKTKLLQQLRAVENDMQAIISNWPTVWVSSTDDDYARPSGKYHIDCDPSKLNNVKIIHSASEHEEVELKSGEMVKLNEFFSEEEIDSMKEE